MKTTDNKDELTEKIITGIKQVRKKLIEFKKQKNSEIVIMEKGRIVKIKPDKIDE